MAPKAKRVPNSTVPVGTSSSQGPAIGMSSARLTAIHDPKDMERAMAERAGKRAAKSAEKKEAGEKLKNEGNDHFRNGEYEAAVRCYTNAVQVNGSKPVYNCNLSAAYLKLGLYEYAATAAERALAHDPSYLKARYRRAIARKELNLLEAAITDFETIITHDPSNTEVQTELALTRKRWESGEGDNTYSDDEYPPHDADKWHPGSDCDSDSSDCKHEGNGIACSFYNHAGCKRGEECRFSHAPDYKSLRDKLGKNVCLFYLLGICKFGDAKCIYSHSKQYLPDGGWWEDEHGMEMRRALIMAAVEAGREQRVIERLRDMREGIEPRRRMGEVSGVGEKGKKKGKEKGKAKQKHKGLAQSGKKTPDFVFNYKPKFLDSDFDPDNELMEQRMNNCGFTDEEAHELLCQGVKPWDDDAWDVWHALNDY